MAVFRRSARRRAAIGPAPAAVVPNPASGADRPEPAALAPASHELPADPGAGIPPQPTNTAAPNPAAPAPIVPAPAGPASVTAAPITAVPTAPVPAAPAPGGLGPLAPVKVERTRLGLLWVMACAALLLLIALIVFIAQNVDRVEISFLGLHGRFPLAVALLGAAAVGALVTIVVGSARIFQLRRTVVRRDRVRRAAAPDGGPAAERSLPGGRPDRATP